MKKSQGDIAGFLMWTLILGIVLLAILPAVYVIKTAAKTHSVYLIATLIAMVVVGLLAVISRTTCLTWMAGILGLATLIITVVEEGRLGQPDPAPKVFPRPFEGSR